MGIGVQCPEQLAGVAPDARADGLLVLHQAVLGASAGAFGGAVVGGIGGRLAMFILRVTSDDSVRGVETEDGFTIGRFDLLDTLNLLAVTAALGSVVGLIVVFGRPFLPKRLMPVAWLLAGSTFGTSILIEPGGVDFTLLAPRWLAVVLFIGIFGLGAGLIAWLVSLYQGFWWRRKKLTAVVALPALVPVIAFPIAIAALIVGVGWWGAMRSSRLRRLPGWMPARVAALVVFAGVIVAGSFGLYDDVTAIV